MNQRFTRNTQHATARLGLAAALVLSLSAATGWGQTTLFSDDFGTSTGSTYDTTGAIGTSATWSLTLSGSDWGARIHNGILDLSNDAGATANANGWIFGYRDINALSGWNTTLSSNTGTITWEFNIRANRSNLAGFGAGSYGLAFILAGTSTSANNTGSGYALVLGNSSTPDPFRLVSFNNGLAGTQTTIITSNTTGFTDIGTRYYSVRVTYNPSNNTWELFLRDDGTTAFTDPTGGTALTSQGTAVNSTYTSTAGMRYIGGWWQGATGANQTAFFDNVYLKKTEAATVPAAPTITSITPGNGQLSVAFTAGADGGSAITNYQYSTDGGTSWRNRASGSTATPLSITTLSTDGTTALSNGTSYNVQIRAVNTVGNGTASSTTAATPRTTPGAPTITSITLGNGTLSVAFTAPSNDGGSTITNYKYSTDGGSNFTAVSPAATTSPISITGLNNGTSYNVQIRAVNAAGDGTATASTAATPRTTPGAPTSLAVTAGNNQLTASFTAPASNGGSAITNYEYSINGGSTFTAVSPASTSTSIVITGLTNGTPYDVQVRAVNAAGSGTSTASVAGTPAAPASPTISVAPATLASALSTTYGTASSTANFTVSGSTLSGNLTVTAPTGLEVSLSSGSGYADTLNLTATSGTVTATTVFARLKATAAAGNYDSQSILIAGGSAEAQNISTSSNGNTVAPKVITITGLGATGKVYDGTTSVTITGTAAYDGLVNGEGHSVTDSVTWSFPDENIGTGKVLTRSASYTAPNANYSLPAQPSLTADITAKELTGSFTANNKAFDNTTAATVATRAVDGKIGSEDVNHTGGTATFANANVGNDKVVTLASATLTGADAGNYTLTSVSTTTANITQGAAEITFNALPAGKKVGDAAFSAGATATLGATISYTSSNTAVATVNASTGLITLVAPGVTTITATVAGTGNFTGDTRSQPLNVGAALTPGNAVSSTIAWDFGTAAPSSGAVANLTVGDVAQGNNNGSTPLLTTTSASSGYTGSSGTTNAGAAARIGALDTAANGSAYFEFTLTPAASYNFTITAISFGSRSTGSGPTAYSLRSSADSYASDLTTGSFTANSSWALKNNTGLSINRSAATTYRIYGHSGTGTATAGTANWRIDDLSLSVTVTSPEVPAVPTITPSGTFAAVSSTFGSASAASATTATVTGGSLTDDITATAPTGFEVSSDGTTYGTTATFTQSGGFASGTLYLRLAASAAVGAYNSQVVTLTSSGATEKTVSIANSSVSALPAGAPAITGVTAGDGQLSVAFTAPASNGGASITNYEYSLNGGSTWLTPDPAVTSSPLLITGLANGTTYDVQIRAVNSAGGGTATATSQATPEAPAVPTLGVAPATFASAMTTTYGTPSSTRNFTVTGAALNGSPVTVTPAAGLEVSASADFSTTIGTSTSPLSLGTSASISTTVHVRLAATAAAGNYNGQSISVAGGGVAVAETVSTASSGNTVAPKVITITGLGATGKVYDGTTSVTITGTAAYGGLANGESHSVTDSVTWSYPDKDIGTGKVLTQSTSYTAPNANYSLPDQPSLTADITAKELAGSFTANDKAFDNTTAATVRTRAVSGKIGSEDVNHTGGTATFDNANVGNDKVVTLASATLTGTDAGNYTLTSVSTTTANITQGAASITFNALPAGKKVGDAAFSAGATATLGASISYSSSNTAVATVNASTGLITLVAPGVTTITATVAGTANFTGDTRSQTLNVGAAGGGGGEYSISFEGVTEIKTSYGSGSVTLSGISWNMTEALVGGTEASDFKNGTKSARLRGYATSSMTMLADFDGGIGTISFQHRRYGTDTQIEWIVEYSMNAGTSWTQAGTFTAGAEVGTFSATVNESGAGRIRIRTDATGTSSRRANIDDIVITGVASEVAGVITPSGSFAAVTTTYGTASAASATTATVTGGSLTADITATAPAGFQVSSDGTTYGATATFTQTGGFANGTLYLRLAANAAAGAYNSQMVTLSSAGASNQTVAIANSSVSAGSLAAGDITLTPAGDGSYTASGPAGSTFTLSYSGRTANGIATSYSSATAPTAAGYYTATATATGNYTGSNTIDYFVAGPVLANDTGASSYDLRKPQDNSMFFIDKAVVLANDKRIDSSGAVQTTGLDIASVAAVTGSISYSSPFIVYTPTSAATDTFTYSVTADGVTATATVTVVPETNADVPTFTLQIVRIATVPALAGGNTTVTVDFIGVPNKSYEVMYKGDLGEATWTSTGSHNTGESGSFSVTVTKAGDHVADWASMFFQAKVNP